VAVNNPSDLRSHLGGTASRPVLRMPAPPGGESRVSASSARSRNWPIWWAR